MDHDKCKLCEYFSGLPHFGVACEGCIDNDHFSKLQIPPSPELLLADCLKQIAESIESMAKLQNDMNDMMREFILTNMRLSDSIIFANKKLDRLSESMHTLHQKVDPDITWNCEADGPTFSPEYLKEAADFLNGFLHDIVKEDQDEGSEETPV